VLRYAHEHGDQWDAAASDTMGVYAAANGQLEALRYAHEHDCPMELDKCCMVAMRYGHTAVVDYLLPARMSTCRAGSQFVKFVSQFSTVRSGTGID
jgi:hypothetical protein